MALSWGRSLDLRYDIYELFFEDPIAYPPPPPSMKVETNRVLDIHY